MKQHMEIEKMEQEYKDLLDSLKKPLTSPGTIEIEKKEVAKYLLANYDLHNKVIQDWLQSARAASLLMSMTNTNGSLARVTIDYFALMITMTKNYLDLKLISGENPKTIAQKAVSNWETRLSSSFSGYNSENKANFFIQAKEIYKEFKSLDNSALTLR